MFVLDTNTLIYFFKGQGAVAKRLLSTPPADIGIPAIVLFALEVGLAKSENPCKRREQLESFIQLVTFLPFGLEEAKCAATIRAQLEGQGRPIGPFDLLIAGTALARKGVLVTRNTKEFTRIPELEIEDWF